MKQKRGIAVTWLSVNIYVLILTANIVYAQDTPEKLAIKTCKKCCLAFNKAKFYKPKDGFQLGSCQSEGCTFTASIQKDCIHAGQFRYKKQRACELGRDFLKSAFAQEPVYAIWRKQDHSEEGYYCEESSNGQNTISLTKAPTPAPTNFPTPAPTNFPTPAPTNFPTPAPTNFPTPAPTNFPTPAPTNFPTPAPTNFPTPAPTNSPTSSPTTPQPTTLQPTNTPTTIEEFKAGKTKSGINNSSGPSMVVTALAVAAVCCFLVLGLIIRRRRKKSQENKMSSSENQHSFFNPAGLNVFSNIPSMRYTNGQRNPATTSFSVNTKDEVPSFPGAKSNVVTPINNYHQGFASDVGQIRPSAVLNDPRGARMFLKPSESAQDSYINSLDGASHAGPNNSSQDHRKMSTAPIPPPRRNTGFSSFSSYSTNTSGSITTLPPAIVPPGLSGLMRPNRRADDEESLPEF